MPTQASFKRIVLSLQASVPGRSVELASEMADLLRLDLLGLFMEDVGLRNLAAMPFVREFRSLGSGWHAIDTQRLSDELEVAARNVERMFSTATRRAAVRCRFELIRGSVATTLPTISEAGDIIMVVEPANPAERATQQFLWLVEAAFKSAAAVMLVPARIARVAGPVVAVATAPDDPSIGVAAELAALAKEEVIALRTYGRRTEPPAADHASEIVVRDVYVGPVDLDDPRALLAVMPPLGERLVVMTRRAASQQAALALVAARKVPVLAVT